MAQKGLTCLVLGLENMGIVDRIFRMFVAENIMQEKAKKKISVPSTNFRRKQK